MTAGTPSWGVLLRGLGADGARPPPPTPRYRQFVRHNGETKTVAEWLRRYGIKGVTFRARLRRGVDIATACTEPPMEKAECGRRGVRL